MDSVGHEVTLPQSCSENGVVDGGHLNIQEISAANDHVLVKMERLEVEENHSDDQVLMDIDSEAVNNRIIPPDGEIAQPRTTRFQRRVVEETQRKQVEVEEMAKRFREQSAAGLNNDIIIQPVIMPKIEVKEEIESDSERGEQGEEFIENLQQTLISGNPAQVTPVPGEETGTTSTNSNPTGKRSVEELMNLVFSTDQEDTARVREMIIAHIILDETHTVSSGNHVRSVRLVSKDWLHLVNKILLKRGLPLHTIKLLPQNSLNNSYDVQQDGGKILDRFTKVMEHSFQVPPILLKIFPYVFLEENHQSFSNFFAKLSSGLVELHMCFPKTGGSMTFLFPGVNLTFPHLQKILLSFCGVHLDVPKIEDLYRYLNLEGSPDLNQVTS